MATTITSSNVTSNGSGDSTWRNRSENYGGGYSAARFLFTGTNFPTSAVKITVSLSCNEDSNTAFTPYLYVGDSSPSDYSQVDSKCTKVGTFSSTKGSASWSGTLTCTITSSSTISTFLSKIRTGNYLYITGTNTSSKSVNVDCKTLTVTLEDNLCYVWNGSSWKGATPYVYNGGWHEASVKI